MGGARQRDGFGNIYFTIKGGTWLSGKVIMRNAIIISAVILLIGGGIALVMIKRKRADPQAALGELISKPEPEPPPVEPTLPLPGALQEKALTGEEKRLLDGFCKLKIASEPVFGKNAQIVLLREPDNARTQYGITKSIWEKSGRPGSLWSFYQEIRKQQGC
jgi:hypothetical protein